MVPSKTLPLVLDPKAFDPASVTPEAEAWEDYMVKLGASNPEKWWMVGAPEFRRRRKAGETSYPPPKVLDSGSPLTVQSREPGRTIPCRALKPQNGKALTGVYMHIHGGGWVIGDEESTDDLLQRMANAHGLVCVSVGYRLAPENPFPAAPDDCNDVAEWLILNGQASLGAPLAFIGGESAGGYLTAVVALHLLQHKDKRFSESRLRGLILNYGCFDLAGTPAGLHMAKRTRLPTLNNDDMDHFRDAFVPGWTFETLRRPEISPIFTDFEALRGKLPAALFICGTRDCLLDDSLFMSTKWLSAGGDTAVEIVPGAHHGFIQIPKGSVGTGLEQAVAAMDSFISKNLQDTGKDNSQRSPDRISRL